MQDPQNYTLLRRILFPYSGEEQLSGKRALRVIVAWATLIPLSMSLFTLLIAVLAPFSLLKTGLLFVLTFLSGALIFGGLGVVVVSMNNRAVRIRQAWRARRGQL